MFKVLVVDDDPSIIVVLESLLSQAGIVKSVSTGMAGIKVALDWLPDAILLDLSLPDIYGLEVLKKLQSIETVKDIPVFIITSEESKKIHIEALSNGAKGWIQKPISEEIMLKSIIGHLKSRQSTKTEHQKYLSTHEEYKEIVRMLADAVIITDEKGIIISVNDYCLKLFGYEKEELIGQNVKILTPPDIRKHHDSYIEKHNNTGIKNLIGKPRQLNTVTKDGRPIIIELNLSEFISNSIRNYVGIIRDVTEKVQTERELLQHLMIDSLSGLGSLNGFRYKYQNKDSRSIIACILDIDDFNNYNTAFGLQEGDILLKKIGTTLKQISIAKNIDTYRIYGDRFLLAVYSDTEDLSFKKDILIQLVENNIQDLTTCLSTRIPITGFCGVFSTANDNVNTIIQDLEIGLRRARKDGDRGLIVKASMLDFSKERLIAALTMQLSSGLNLETLSVVFQPKVDREKRICSLEALLRWNDSAYEGLGLYDFITTAENTGAIIDVAYFVIEEVCRLLNEIPEEKRKTIFVNLSIKELSNKGFISTVVSILEKNNIPSSLIGFEITETLISDRFSIVQSQIQKLRDIGHEVAIDDFGTGQSNLRYVHKLPISSLKIDKSFIDDITDSTQTYPLIDTIIDMAKNMHVSSVAEGVEEEEQVKYLFNKNVDEIQGYYFYKPMPYNDCRSLLLEK